MKGVLLKQRNKEGEISLSDKWTLSAKGNYPERQMTTFSFYNLDEGTIERLTLNDDEMRVLKLYNEIGQEVELIKIQELFSDLNDGLTEIEVETENKKKGKYSIETVIAFKVIGTVGLDR